VAVSNPVRGRDGELASLHEHLARLRSRVGTCWLIEAGPGGDTHLAGSAGVRAGGLV